jgi:hypothetical protein
MGYKETKSIESYVYEYAAGNNSIVFPGGIIQKLLDLAVSASTDTA